MKTKTTKAAGKASLDPLVLRPTSRGFLRADFRDGNGDECSIQESSAAEAPFLWLGQNTGTHHMGECMARMHLTQANAAALIPLLRYFVRHGRLPQNIRLTEER